MATDQKISTIDTEPVASGPVIENEIPTYRAISARAIFSVAFGVLSACTLAHPFFYVFAILAIGFGIWAHLKIQQFPDMLTGQGLANVGIGLGLVFGLASGTFSTVQYFVQVQTGESVRHEVCRCPRTRPTRVKCSGTTLILT